MKSKVIIIGAGVVGSAVARELSRYNLDITVLEKDEDVCTGTSKANSGICHAGFDAECGTLKAKLNVEGSKMMEELSKKLDFPYQRIGALVLCDDEKRIGELEKLYDKGIKNGVDGMKIVHREELKELEPNVPDTAVAALLATTSAIICPFELNIALAENAAMNGVKFVFDAKVTDVRETGSHKFVVETVKGNYEADYVISAMGVYSDVLHNKFFDDKIHVTARKGEYYLLDKSAGGHAKHTIFHLPDEFGKGVLVTPTVHGNLLVGPTAVDTEDKEGVETTLEGLKMVKDRSGSRAQKIPFGEVITTFAGLRAHGDRGDFVIEEAPKHPGFISLAGIESPGLSSAPAIGCMVRDMVVESAKPEKNSAFVEERKGIVRLKDQTREVQEKLIKERPEYGTIVCRCEMISEAEVIDALTRIIPARSLDGVKRRVRAGMGRCHAGFCTPRTMELIERYCKIPMEEVTKCGGNSKMILGTVKDRL